MKKVLIIGSKGMLGQELAEAFSNDEGYEVTGWDIEDIDVTEKEQVEKKVSDLKPAFIFNATAYNAVDRCEESEEEFEKAKKLNAEAPGYLAEVAKKNGAVLVHYSTDYVFDGMPELGEPEGCTHVCSTCTLHDSQPQEFGFNEEAQPDPLSNYGKSKLMGEQNVQKIGEKFYIIRLSKLFGKPAQAEGGKRSFFDVMLEAGKNNDKVKVVDEEISCFTYAPDLAMRSKEIVEEKRPFGVYHVTNADACTWYEAVVELYRQAGLKTKVIPVSADEFPRPAERPYVSTLINTKLEPLRSYKEALKEYLENIR